ncbi:class IV adenylate cyclase [Halobacteriales archaeon QS_4_69_31]|nr:MAG: class IV adenylate cyclase [Halobacteriales archaeon QS_4_69_31]
MYEVEVKVRADHGTVRPRLAELGADPLGSVTQADTYYDAPHRNFAATDEALRIRRERTGDAERVELTYKGPLLEAESKSREEHETAVSDAAATEGILDGLGFEPAATVRKERERFEHGEFTVALDTVEGLGEFVEAETGTADEDIAAAREEARDLLAALGLDPADQIRTSYLGLLLDADSQE